MITVRPGSPEDRRDPRLARLLACTWDHHCWNPTSYRLLVEHLRKAGISCWVSGGWAIDLFLGRQTREHADTDISILRKDQLQFAETYRDWEIFHTQAPGLRLWRPRHYLAHCPNLWLRDAAAAPWRFEVMFQESEDDIWIYRRNRRVTRRLEEIGLETNDGIPYLRPEIQLLYKGGGSSFRPHDREDLMQVLPVLPTESKLWLRNALHTEFPAGHGWIDIIDRSLQA